MDRTSFPTSVKHCSCYHRFQDRTYGYGQRLHNPTKDGWRCTVCGHEQKVGGSDVGTNAASH